MLGTAARSSPRTSARPARRAGTARAARPGCDGGALVRSFASSRSRPASRRSGSSRRAGPPGSRDRGPATSRCGVGVPLLALALPVEVEQRVAPVLVLPAEIRLELLRTCQSMPWFADVLCLRSTWSCPLRRPHRHCGRFMLPTLTLDGSVVQRQPASRRSGHAIASQHRRHAGLTTGRAARQSRRSRVPADPTRSTRGRPGSTACRRSTPRAPNSGRNDNVRPTGGFTTTKLGPYGWYHAPPP